MSRIPMFADLDASAPGTIIPLVHSHNLPPHLEVLAEGSEGLHRLGQGACAFARRHRDAGTGDVFGVVAMLDNDVQKATFVTASRCRLLKLHREDFHRLAVANPGVAASIR